MCKVVRLVVYGTMRRNQPLSYVIPSDHGTMEIMELSGLSMYVIGECPAVKLDGISNTIIAEVWEFSQSIGLRCYLAAMDEIEGVEAGLYRRRTIDTPKGPALIYEYCGDVTGCDKVQDWMEWIKSGKKASNPTIVLEQAE